jgi:hypothetical protein
MVRGLGGLLERVKLGIVLCPFGSGEREKVERAGQGGLGCRETTLLERKFLVGIGDSRAIGEPIWKRGLTCEPGVAHEKTTESDTTVRSWNRCRLCSGSRSDSRAGEIETEELNKARAERACTGSGGNESQHSYVFMEK